MLMVKKLTGFVDFFTSIWWVISVDILVISTVERCCELELMNYFIPLKKLNYCTIRPTKTQYVFFKVYETSTNQISLWYHEPLQSY